MSVNPLLDPQEITKERTVILEEAKMYKDLPQSYVYELLDELMWPGQPLGMTIIGTPESINRIDREQLALFKNQYYVPSNIVVSVAGSLEHDKFINRISSIFSSLKTRDVKPFLKVKEEQTKPQLNLLHKDTEQTHLALGFHGVKREDHLKYSLSLLHIILGANMSSRLFNEVREKKGLAYEIGTQVKYFQDTGAFIVHAGIDNRKVNNAVELILKELKKTKYNLVSADELKRAKEFYLGQLAISLEDTLDHMLWIGESTASIGKVYSLKDIIRKINQVKREDIRKAAQYVFKEKSLNTAIIGPLKDSQQSIYNQLGL
jgi:predicted Zn-dependent peptidase